MTTPLDRRRFRFNLRTMLVSLCVICAISAVVAHRMRRGERQKEAAAWVRARGGIVEYDFELDEDLQLIWHTKPGGVRVPGRESPAMEYLRERIGVDYFATPVSVSLVGSECYPRREFGDLSPLADLPQLVRLDLRQACIGNLSGLTNVTTLKCLNIAKTAVHDLSSLANLTKLEELDLCDTKVSDLTALAGMTKLKRLFLSRTLVRDASPLATVTALKRLDLNHTDVRDVTPLAGMSHLEELDLTDTQVTNVMPLEHLTYLQTLFLVYTDVTSEQVAKLKKALPCCKIYHHPRSAEQKKTKPRINALCGRDLTVIAAYEAQRDAVDEASSEFASVPILL